MPRVKLGETEARKEAMRSTIRMYMAKYKMTYQQFSKKLGICKNTAIKWGNYPNLCTMEQLELIMKVLKIPPEEMEVFIPWSRAS